MKRISAPLSSPSPTAYIVATECPSNAVQFIPPYEAAPPPFVVVHFISIIGDSPTPAPPGAATVNLE